jgi:hypothetical protein
VISDVTFETRLPDKAKLFLHGEGGEQRIFEKKKAGLPKDEAQPGFFVVSVYPTILDRDQ